MLPRVTEPKRRDGTRGRGGLDDLLRMLSPLPFLLVGAVVLTVPDVLSPSGWVYVASIGLMGWGMVRGPHRGWPKSVGEARSAVGPGTLGLLVFLGLARHTLAVRTPGAEPTLGPEGTRGRVLTRLFEERDGAVLGARWMSVLLAGRELGGLGGVFATHYPRMSADGVALGTAILPTYLGLQREAAFDLHVIDPRGPRRALEVVFLHGSGGSFSLLCWQVAIAVRDHGVRTSCPAMASSGDWAGRRGRPILEALLDQLGERPLLIVGLSAGGLALSEMAPELVVEHPNVVGLVLVSGTARDAEPTALPTLLLHGARDRMQSIETAEAYAVRAPNARLVTLPSGHFALLEDHQTVEAELGRFVDALP